MQVITSTLLTMKTTMMMLLLSTLAQIVLNLRSCDAHVVVTNELELINDMARRVNKMESLVSQLYDENVQLEKTVHYLKAENNKITDQKILQSLLPNQQRNLESYASSHKRLSADIHEYVAGQQLLQASIKGNFPRGLFQQWNKV